MPVGSCAPILPHMSLAPVCLASLVVVVTGCGAATPAGSSASPPPAEAPVAAAPTAAAVPAPAAPTVHGADTPATTRAGHRFIAPAGWSLRVAGAATIVESPEAGSWIAFPEADDAVTAAAAAARDTLAAWRRSLEIPAATAVVAGLAARYRNDCVLPARVREVA
jgi:hypothetical protein